MATEREGTIKSCENCKWLSDLFTSVCCNSASENCADFVSKTDVCDKWELKINSVNFSNLKNNM